MECYKITIYINNARYLFCFNNYCDCFSVTFQIKNSKIILHFYEKNSITGTKRKMLRKDIMCIC